jgi:hypothetical protein
MIGNLTAAEMKFTRSMAGSTHLVIMKDSNKSFMEFIENYRPNWRSHVLQMPHSEFSITNHKDEDHLWEDSTVAGTRL